MTRVSSPVAVGVGDIGFVSGPWLGIGVFLGEISTKPANNEERLFRRPWVSVVGDVGRAVQEDWCADDTALYQRSADVQRWKPADPAERRCDSRRYAGLLMTCRCRVVGPMELAPLVVR